MLVSMVKRHFTYKLTKKCKRINKYFVANYLYEDKSRWKKIPLKKFNTNIKKKRWYLMTDEEKKFFLENYLKQCDHRFTLYQLRQNVKSRSIITDIEKDIEFNNEDLKELEKIINIVIYAILGLSFIIIIFITYYYCILFTDHLTLYLLKTYG